MHHATTQSQLTKASVHGSRARHFLHCNVVHTCEVRDGDGWTSPRYAIAPCQACEDLNTYDQVSAEVYDESAYFMPTVEVC